MSNTIRNLLFPVAVAAALTAASSYADEAAQAPAQQNEVKQLNTEIKQEKQEIRKDKAKLRADRKKDGKGSPEVKADREKLNQDRAEKKALKAKKRKLIEERHEMKKGEGVKVDTTK